LLYARTQTWAEKTTAWEGHVSPAAAENVYIAKLFAYQFVNAYSALFYIAFWVRDKKGLEEVLNINIILYCHS
jgi:Calcium-activated chloride channel